MRSEKPTNDIEKPASKMSRYREVFGIVTILLLVMVAGLMYGAYRYGQNQKAKENTSLKGQISSLKSRLLQAEKAPSYNANPSAPNSQTAKKTEPVSTNCTPSTTDTSLVQTAATAWLRRGPNITITAPPSFRAIETTNIKGCFAIQNYCAPVEGDCSSLALRKVDDTWIPIGSVGLGDIDENTLQGLNSDYGWPLDFAQ